MHAIQVVFYDIVLNVGATWKHNVCNFLKRYNKMEQRFQFSTYGMSTIGKLAIYNNSIINILLLKTV